MQVPDVPSSPPCRADHDLLVDTDMFGPMLIALALAFLLFVVSHFLLPVREAKALCISVLPQRSRKKGSLRGRVLRGSLERLPLATCTGLPSWDRFAPTSF